MTIVLVPGAFRGPGYWGRVRDRLDAAGTGSLSVDLHAGPLTLAGYVASITDSVAAANRGGEPVVAVGHSMGGFFLHVAVTQVAVTAALFLDAPLPADGDRAVDMAPPGHSAPPNLDPDLVLAPAVSADLDPDDAAWLAAHLRPEPLRPSLEPVQLGPLRPPTRLAFCAATPEHFPCWHTRARLGEQDYDLLDAGHDAAVSTPELVAAWILDAVPG